MIETYMIKDRMVELSENKFFIYDDCQVYLKEISNIRSEVLIRLIDYQNPNNVIEKYIPILEFLSKARECQT